jgi:hypothetical protein
MFDEQVIEAFGVPAVERRYCPEPPEQYRYWHKITLCHLVTHEEWLLEFGSDTDNFIWTMDEVKRLRGSALWGIVDNQCVDALEDPNFF